MNPVNPKKLLHSKWTAVTPANREKHFSVVEVHDDEAGHPVTCVLQAAHSGNHYKLAWRDLKDSTAWRIGWR
ncbi:MAG: TIGR02450 family Trp-rich protein [Gammaproteobacteria bacterium]